MLKTLWPKYLLFKNKIEAINIEQIDFENISYAKAEFTTPPVFCLLYTSDAADE